VLGTLWAHHGAGRLPPARCRRMLRGAAKLRETVERADTLQWVRIHHVVGVYLSPTCADGERNNHAFSSTDGQDLTSDCEASTAMDATVA